MLITSPTQGLVLFDSPVSASLWPSHEIRAEWLCDCLVVGGPPRVQQRLTQLASWLPLPSITHCLSILIQGTYCTPISTTTFSFSVARILRHVVLTHSFLLGNYTGRQSLRNAPEDHSVQTPARVRINPHTGVQLWF